MIHSEMLFFLLLLLLFNTFLISILDVFEYANILGM